MSSPFADAPGHVPPGSERAWAVRGYTEVRTLGGGGFGEVVLAVHDASGTSVAIKYLHTDLLRDRDHAASFRAEAATLAGLDSPHVVRLYEYVEGPAGAAIVMELVEGVTLARLLERQGSTTPEAALVVLFGSLLGLAAAHARGVVHRDYKPANVLVDSRGASKLTDFGIAALAGSRPAPMGTLRYMPPEQFEGAPASPAADVYAATATFYQCLAGRVPFDGQTADELYDKHKFASVPMEPVPEPLRPIIARGMAKDPQYRPADAARLAAELRDAAVGSYGEGWEDRGRSHLAEAALLFLALLWPSGSAPAAQGITVAKEPPTRPATGPASPDHQTGAGRPHVGRLRPRRPQLSREARHRWHLRHILHLEHVEHLERLDHSAAGRSAEDGPGERPGEPNDRPGKRPRGRLHLAAAAGTAVVIAAGVVTAVALTGHGSGGPGSSSSSATSATSHSGAPSSPAAHAHPTWPPAAWTLSPSPPPAIGLLSVVACPAAGSCTLADAGSQGSTASFALYTLAHGKWVQEATVPTSMPNDSFNVTAMTCPATADCTVAGADYEAVSKRAEVSLIATKSQGHWTTTRLPLPAGSGPGESMQFDGIACPAAGGCVAVGEISQDNTAVNGAPQPVIATLRAGTWTVALAPLPADASASPVAADLTGIACPAPGWCVAVGSYLPLSGAWRPLIETFANGNWVPGTAPLLANTGTVLLYSVACPAAGTCVAVGNNVVGNNTGPGTDPGVIETLTNGTWRTAAAPQPKGRPGQFWGYLWGVACPAPGACVAVGDYDTDRNQDSLPQIDTLSHGTWTAAVAGSLPAGADRKSQSASADGVACTLAQDCVTLGGYTTTQGYQDSLIESTTPL